MRALSNAFSIAFSMALILLMCVVSTATAAESGFIARKSNHNVPDTADRLVAVLQENGMTVFDRINHAEAASAVGLELRPTEVVIFGNPKVGTPLMQCSQSVAIDLPQKILVWKDESGQVWIAYNDPKYLAKRHKIKGCDDVIAKIDMALGNFARAAAGK
ncbi:DUF302 domain-containing protein [Marinobacter caseinilyticus]|uniref:DUF302 domain-containing protein n=1 Tax=Marinobacter caseinilyticus TaxID=2692195 RepID=UPI001F3F8B8E|nr:DUF302 domain-containing protein [Marinobacter caseinilyticus]